MNVRNRTQLNFAPIRVTRRRFVLGLTTTVGAALLTACGSTPPAAKPTEAPAKPAAPAASPASAVAPPPVAIGGQPSPSPAAAASPAASPAAAASPATAASPSPAAAAAAAPARAPAAPGRTVEITFSHIWATPPGATEAQKHPAELVAEAFNAKNTGVKVTTRVDSTDYYEILQKAQAELAAGKPPALVMTPWASILFADSALGITDLETIGGSELPGVLASMNDAALNLVKLNGKTKGLPYALSCPVLYYNNDILKKAGVEPAAMFKDWAAFSEMAPKVKAQTNNPIIGVGTNPDWPAQSMIQNAGGRVLSDDDKPVMDSPEAISALKVPADLTKADLWTNGTTRENAAAFTGGSMACYMGSIAGLGGLRNSVPFDLGTSTFPLHPGGKPRRMSAGGSFIGCYARDKEQQDAAWEFLKFAASEEGTKIWMKTGYINATKFKVPLLPGQDVAYTQLNEGLTRETPWPGKRGAEAQKVWGTYVSRIWSNDISAEEGAKQAKAELVTILA